MSLLFLLLPAIAATIGGLIFGLWAGKRLAAAIAILGVVLGLAGIALAIAMDEEQFTARVIGAVSPYLLLAGSGAIGPAVFSRAAAAITLSLIVTLLLFTVGYYLLLGALCTFDSFCL